MDFYDQKIWRKGCKYIVGKPNEVCSKCGHKHAETAEEAGHALFAPKNTDDEDLPQG